MTIRVATALTDAGRESAVVRAVSEMPDAVVTRRCRDVVELRAVAHSSQVDAVVVDAGLRGLDRDVLASLDGVGVRCIVLGAGDGFTSDGLAVSADVASLPDALRTPVDTSATTAPPVRELSPSADREGHVVVVWGPVGAPGRTTVAIELAASACAAGADVLLVDLDTTGPSVAQLLGLLDDASGVAAAARLGGEGRLTATDIAALAVSVPSGPRVLVGIPSAERWTELRPGAIDEVLRCARDLSDLTVVDLGFGIEGDDLAWLDADAPQRFGAARAALSTADVVVCVGRSDPVGLTRLLKEVPKVQSLAPTAVLEVLLNQVRSAAAGRQARDLVADLLGVVPQVVDADVPAVQRAQMLGVPVRERAPDSAVVAVAERLVERMSGLIGSYHRRREPAGRTHRRLLRSPHRRHRHRDAGVV